mmetsp:Transcript_8417/g.24880  ORF Transcript_8417/g.24880 Transcript_8417/m.24880 type:complete len:356 (+) Transcript_8417:219-1286(+)
MIRCLRHDRHYRTGQDRTWHPPILESTTVRNHSMFWVFFENNSQKYSIPLYSIPLHRRKKSCHSSPLLCSRVVALAWDGMKTDRHLATMDRISSHLITSHIHLVSFHLALSYRLHTIRYDTIRYDTIQFDSIRSFSVAILPRLNYRCYCCCCCFVLRVVVAAAGCGFCHSLILPAAPPFPPSTAPCCARRSSSGPRPWRPIFLPVSVPHRDGSGKCPSTRPGSAPVPAQVPPRRPSCCRSAGSPFRGPSRRCGETGRPRPRPRRGEESRRWRCWNCCYSTRVRFRVCARIRFRFGFPPTGGFRCRSDSFPSGNRRGSSSWAAPAIPGRPGGARGPPGASRRAAPKCRTSGACTAP